MKSDMRTKQEIRQAVAILRHKGDRISMLQAATLEEGRNEAWVFATYVTSVPEGAKDEAAFFAARFAAGHIGLEELIPDVQSMTAADFAAAGALGTMDEPKRKREKQTVSVQEFEALKRKVRQLEGFVEDLLKERRQRAEYQKLPDTNRADFIGQKEATELVGCSRETLNAWQRKGFITGYRKAGLVYYSKSELAASSVVQNFINIKDRRK
jgi:hypothetical protein